MIITIGKKINDCCKVSVESKIKIEIEMFKKNYKHDFNIEKEYYKKKKSMTKKRFALKEQLTKGKWYALH